MGPRGNSHSYISTDAPAELVAVRFGVEWQTYRILIPTSFLQVREIREDVIAELILMVNPLYHITSVAMLNYE
jgi:hypothetical protein